MSCCRVTITERQDGSVADVIEFELLDNPGARAWQYAVMLNAKSRQIRYRSAIEVKSWPENAGDLHEELFRIQNELADTEFPFQDHIPASLDELDQDFLNRAHRHFTNSCGILWNPRRARSRDMHMDHVLHRLNDVVHELELAVPTAHKTQYGGRGLEIWLPNDGRELGYDIFPFRQYHSFEPADLILDAYILGKTLLESFACHDDPTAWDVSGHLTTNGGAIVCMDRTRHEIYQSQDFHAWLASWNLISKQVLADFPLGMFRPGHRSRMEAVSHELLRNSQKYSAELDIRL